MAVRIQSALISVYNKEGLLPVVEKLHALGVQIFSTGGTQKFIEDAGLPCQSVESITGYPSILGGRVKTLHPSVFGGILARRDLPGDLEQLAEYKIPLLDLVMVDLYPFEETVLQTNDRAAIIEKIDIGGVSLIRAAAKNYTDVAVISNRKQYEKFVALLNEREGNTDLIDRQELAQEAFAECAHYDVSIAAYFNAEINHHMFQVSHGNKQVLRYGENPHQKAEFFGHLDQLFKKLNGKELSYNNLVDVDAAIQLMAEFEHPAFAIVKHTNVCGMAERGDVLGAFEAALAGDPESAFGGILISNRNITVAAASKMTELFFEVLIAPGYDADALSLLTTKKNRIILRQTGSFAPAKDYKRMLNGVLIQDTDAINFSNWQQQDTREISSSEKADLIFANIVCKHLKSNAIAIVKNMQLVGKGCGQTSRVDALRQAINKAKQNGFDLKGSVLASDAFFPFDDCVRLAHEAGIVAVIEPGGSVRDKDSINYCIENNMAIVFTGTRHFKH